MKLCISTSIFGTEENSTFLLAFLQKVKIAGFEYIEIGKRHHDLRLRAEEINDLNLKVWSVHGTLSAGSIDLDERVRRQAVEKEFIRLNDAAVYAPCPYVIHYLNRMNDPRYSRQFRKSIEELLQKAIELNITLALETAPYKPQLNERYPDSREIADFVHSFESPNLGITVDINHSNLKEDLNKVAENCTALIANIHVSDNMGQWEDHLPPGDGIIDIRGTLKELIKAGYKGPCNVECHYPQPTINILRKIKNQTEAICGDL
jgi:sugar phosphate isomerase/epimerase